MGIDDLDKLAILSNAYHNLADGGAKASTTDKIEALINHLIDTSTNPENQTNG